MTPFNPQLKKTGPKLGRNTKAWKMLVKSVFERDGYKCVGCGNIFPENMLAPHHVKSVGAGGWDIKSNLISLCKFCHYDIHNGNLKITDIIKRKLRNKENG